MRGVVLLLCLAGCEAPAPHRPALLQMVCPKVPAKPTHLAPPPLAPVSDAPLRLAPAHFDFVGHSYVWVPAEWVPVRGAHPMWQDGYWSPNGGACEWHSGRFLP